MKLEAIVDGGNYWVIAVRRGKDGKRVIQQRTILKTSAGLIALDKKLEVANAVKEEQVFNTYGSALEARDVGVEKWVVLTPYGRAPRIFKTRVFATTGPYTRFLYKDPESGDVSSNRIEAVCDTKKQALAVVGKKLNRSIRDLTQRLESTLDDVKEEKRQLSLALQLKAECRKARVAVPMRRKAE